MRPSKLKRNLIIIFSVILVIMIILLVLYITTDIFRTKRDVFFRYFGQIPEITKILETSSEYEEYTKTKKNIPYIRNGEMIIVSSRNIADENILNKIKLTLDGKTDSISEKSVNKISIKSANNELFNMTIAKDKNLYGFYADQIADGYIGIRNKELNNLIVAMQDNNIQDEIMSVNAPDEIMPVNIEEIFNVSNVEKKHIEKYIKMIRDKAPDTAYTKEEKKKIEIEGQKYETTAATLKLDEDSNRNLQIEILEELTKDSIMMNYITSKCKLMNLTGNCTDINSLNNAMKSRIEDLELRRTVEPDITITVYEYKQKNIQTVIQINEVIIKITHINIDKEELVKIELGHEDIDRKTSVEIRKTKEEHKVKFYQEEDTIEKSIEFIYSMTGKVDDNTIQNHLTVNAVNDIKEITYEYNDSINFTKDIGNLNEMQAGKVLIINDYNPSYIKEFVDLVKTQINLVYINQAASIGVNVDPIF